MVIHSIEHDKQDDLFLMQKRSNDFENLLGETKGVNFDVGEYYSGNKICMFSSNVSQCFGFNQIP